ncbi:hypothetical protein B4090_3354 [Bacillus licheniformis]|nr:hypothetical protein B4090_3354 [Bacillus licheniformis]OLF86183.1 hypothetical protein B4094_4647 [Bacillus licheniformis]OLF89121.1 hypothetical protein B4089_3216 [Bacillus licheniformis]TWK68250.1 hypothetical protein CHCC20342_2794 [Bacillus licheniformis]TWL64803.1 hypothetical protein CHCC15322_2996 [Bacillus licheniformis]
MKHYISLAFSLKWQKRACRDAICRALFTGTTPLEVELF